MDRVRRHIASVPGLKSLDLDLDHGAGPCLQLRLGQGYESSSFWRCGEHQRTCRKRH
jgi:hypothetical protein